MHVVVNAGVDDKLQGLLILFVRVKKNNFLNRSGQMRCRK